MSGPQENERLISRRPSAPSSDLSPDSETQVAPKHRLKVVTAATHSDGYFRALQASAARLNLDFTVLGWGQKWSDLAAKIQLVRQFAESVPKDDIILFLDGFDTVILQPEEIIIKRFLHHRKRFVSCGESCEHIWLAFHNSLFRTPENEEVPWPDLPLYAPKELNLRLLNSGCYIAYASEVVKVFAGLADKDCNDQMFLTTQFLAGRIAVDSNCNLFHLWRGERSCEILPADIVRKRYPYKRPYYTLEEFSELNTENKNNKDTTSSTKGELTLKRGDDDEVDGTFVDCELTKAGVVVDTKAGAVPCVLHIHCRRNADNLMRALDLPVMEGNTLWRRAQYYAYSLNAHKKASRGASVLLLGGIAGCAGLGVCLVAAVVLLLSLWMPTHLSTESATVAIGISSVVTAGIWATLIGTVKYINRRRCG